jgi:bifunctional DNase/RNase
MSDSEESFPDFIEARLDSISVTNVGFILFLKGGDDKRVLPIFIGANEAQSIALALGEDPPPRPMTHDLLKAMLDSLDAAVTRVEITDLNDGTFFAKVYVSRGDIEESEFDARPSDAIALAVRFEAPIFMARKVFEDAAVAVTSVGSPDAENIGMARRAGDEEPMPEETEAQQRTTKTLSPAEKLRADLDKAVHEEHYEEAARLRDALKRLSSGN